MTSQRPLLVVLLAGTAALLVGVAQGPLWDEDEPRFAAIARTMVETGDWVVPVFNDTLAVDKPVLMHWCMAACMSIFGTNEFAARLPSMIAALLTALALLRAGSRFFDTTTGVVAALAWLGCLLAGIEAHAATPDAILTAPLVNDVTSSSPVAPVYAFLKQPPFDGEIPWNYTKFLVGRDGKVLRRYSPGSPLEQGMEDDVRRALKGEPLKERKGVF